MNDNARPVIRLAEDSDAKAFARIYAPYVTDTVISFEMIPPSEAEMRDRFSAISTQYPWLVCENKGEISGYAYAGRHSARAAYEWSIDVSVYIDRNLHRRGIGRALYTTLFAILVQQGFYNAFAGVTLPNAGSVGLHESFGFQQIALYKNVGNKMGKWHDVGWWQMPLRELVDVPEPTKSIHSVADSVEFKSAIATGQKLLGEF
jgi:phosphinothricin acetyltransferase